MKLITQPADGIEPIIKAINKAKKSVEIVVFRFDRPELERALVDAVERGVFVHALIAFTNRGGEKHLRDLESMFLSKGITVARTAGDLVRYHGKMMIVDRKELYVLAFNFTYLDIDHSRSFGVVTRNTKQIQEAVRLFEADSKRQAYSCGNSKFIVSPVNARAALTAFLRGAKKELLIYDPKISDPQMLKVLIERAKSKAKIKVIGEVAGKKIAARKLAGMRLHTRCIIRDRCDAFVGSQSLRKLELDSRREIGIVVRDPTVVAALCKTFAGDWKASERLATKPVAIQVEKVAKKLAERVHEELPVQPVVKRVAKAIKKTSRKKIPTKTAEKLVRSAVEITVKDAVKEAAAEVVKEVVERSA